MEEDIKIDEELEETPDVLDEDEEGPDEEGLDEEEFEEEE